MVDAMQVTTGTQKPCMSRRKPEQYLRKTAEVRLACTSKQLNQLFLQFDPGVSWFYRSTCFSLLQEFLHYRWVSDSTEVRLGTRDSELFSGLFADAWNKLEQYARFKTRSCANVFVVTGPLYLPSLAEDGKNYINYQVIGPQNVAVPSHFFKVRWSSVCTIQVIAVRCNNLCGSTMEIAWSTFSCCALYHDGIANEANEFVFIGKTSVLRSLSQNVWYINACL